MTSKFLVLAPKPAGHLTKSAFWKVGRGLGGKSVVVRGNEGSNEGDYDKSTLYICMEFSENK